MKNRSLVNRRMGLGCALLFVLGVIALRLSLGLGILGASGVMGRSLPLTKQVFTHPGVMLGMAGPLLGFALVYIGITVHRLFTEAKESPRIHGLFGQDILPEVLAAPTQQSQPLGMIGARRESTIFFSDVVGFNAATQGLRPDELVDFIKQYLGTMSDVVFEGEGYLDQCFGDGLMALWNAPIDQPDHAVLACRCALRSVERLRELNRKFVARGWKPLKIRIGLNTGMVVAGHVGSTRKKRYTVMGEPVSLAARLEAANKPFGTAVMLSEFTHAQVKDHFETRYLDCIQVPGKARPIKTYELLCEKGQLTAERRQALERYDEGMKLFHARKFTEAHEHFLRAAALFGQDDKACAVYIERSRAFRQEPPPADWDGIFQVMTS